MIHNSNIAILNSLVIYLYTLDYTHGKWLNMFVLSQLDSTDLDKDDTDTFPESYFIIHMQRPIML
jgi:hypothetical protein